MQKIYNRCILCAFLMVGMLTHSALAQTLEEKVGILELKSNKAVYFNTQVDLAEMLNKKADQEASFEFWVNATLGNSFWELTDLLDDAHNFLALVRNNQIEIKANNKQHTYNYVPASNNWDHFAFVFSQGWLSVYVNSKLVGRLQCGNLLANLSRDLYFKKNVNTSLQVTEIRAWSKRRSPEAIADNQWQTYMAKTNFEMTLLHNAEGLEMLLGGNSQHTETSAQLPQLSYLKWDNHLTKNNIANTDQLPGRGVHKYKDEVLGELKNGHEVRHPVLNNQLITVKASDGKYDDKVMLTWNHIKEAGNYTVYRDDHPIDEKNAGNVVVGSELSFEDKKVFAGVLHTYRIEAKNTSNQDVISSNNEDGFILYNGEFSGKITSQNQIFVEGVKVMATPASTTSLLASPGKSKVVVSNTGELQYGLSGNSSQIQSLGVEFWYKKATGIQGVNRVLQMSGIRIDMEPGKLVAYHNNNQAYIEHSMAADDKWHHYAIVFSANGGRLYIDGSKVKHNQTGFQPGWDNLNMEINPVTQYNAWIDELRIWNADKHKINNQLENNSVYFQRLDKQFTRHYDLMLSGNEPNLLLYYRFDFGKRNYVYNIAKDSRGNYQGKVTNVNWNNQSPALAYGGYTNQEGAYLIDAVAYGSNGANFTITPEKVYKENGTRHSFAPVNKRIKLSPSLDRPSDYIKKDVNFTDISSLPIAGRVYYKTDPAENPATYQDCKSCYPVPAGQQITVDGNLVNGNQTDAAGVYAISSFLGRHAFRVSNPAIPHNLGTRSITFDGRSGYLKSQPGVVSQTTNATWSGWLKPGASNSLQTLLHIGNISLVLKPNQTLAVQKDGQDVLLSNWTIQSNGNQEFIFFAFTYDKLQQKFGLYVNNAYVASPQAVSGVNMAGELMLGARKKSGNPVDFFKGNLDQVEYRNKLYSSKELLDKLKNGELISTSEIASNEDGLLLSYPFEQTKGNKALSYKDKQNALYLHGGMMWDANGAIYNRSFQYTYIASNQKYNPKGDAYTLNVNQYFDELNFENQTRFGFVGNIVVPCGLNAGDWTGTIVRTDVQDPEFKMSFDANAFNQEKTVFKIENLIPGHYRVELVNQKGQKLQSSVIDITKGWATYDFEVPGNLQVITKLYEVTVDVNTGNLSRILVDPVPVCANDDEPEHKFELKAGKDYQMEVAAYQLFGNGEDKPENRCYVAGGEIVPGGDAGVFLPNPKYLTAQTDNPKTSWIEEKGHAYIPFIANLPNFDGDYTRNLNINANFGGSYANGSIKTYNTGLQKQEQNFTLTEPKVVSILHDPPGGNSSATLKKGFQVTVSESTTAGTDTELDIMAAAGFSVDAKMGYFVGLGGGTLGTFRTTKTKTTVGFGLIQNSTYRRVSGNVSTISFDREISTSSSPTVVGLDADVYIGMSKVIRVGSGRKVMIEGCRATVKTMDKVAKDSVKSMFVYTHQDIKDNVIPKLEELAKKEDNVNQGKDYYRQIRAWSKILKDNADRVANIDQHENLGSSQTLDPAILGGQLSFSGGTSTSYDLTLSSGKFEDEEWGKGIGVKQEASRNFDIFGAALDIKQSFQKIGFNGDAEGNSTSTTVSYGFSLSDDDNGDQFNIAIKKDPVYSTPIFKTKAGQSMCPYEAGTQPREGVEITVDKPLASNLYGEAAVFNLTLRNTQEANDNTPKRYFVAVDRANVPDGAIVRYNGDPLGNGLAIDFMANETIKQGVITVSHPTHASGEKLEYNNIPILFYSGCERDGFLYSSYHIDELKAKNCGSAPYRYSFITVDGNFDEAGYDAAQQTWNDCNNHIKMVDQVTVSAHFSTPCVANIGFVKPTRGWIVNKSNNLTLDLVFAIPGLTGSAKPANLKKIIVQENTPDGPKSLKELSVDVLMQHVKQGYVHYPLNLSGSADGEYNIRLVPVCDDGNEFWEQQNPTEWREGVISRLVPSIIATNPTNAGIMGANKTITITYDSPILNTGVSSANFSLRGVLPEEPLKLRSGRFGANTQITIPHQENLKLDKAYTVEFWIKPESLPGIEVAIIEKGDNLKISLRSDGKVHNGKNISTKALQIGVWTHVFIKYDGSQNAYTFFGDEEVTPAGNPLHTPAVSFATNNQPITIGNGFSGKLDEVRIWNGIARDPNLVKNDRNRRLWGNESHLVGYYVLDEVEHRGTEAIYDFAGVAQNTLAENLTFDTDVAPLVIDKSVVKNVPITVVKSGEREVVIRPLANFNVLYYEGARLTAFIKDHAIKGKYGNSALGKTWNFTVNTNHIAWSQATKTMYLPANRNGEVTFPMGLLNGGTHRVKYRFRNLPAWLRVQNKTAGTEYFLDGTNAGTPVEEVMTFVIAKSLTSKVTAPVEVEILDNEGKPIAVESFVLDIIIQGNSRTATVQEIWATVEIDGKTSDDPLDQLTVQAGNITYGLANITQVNGKPMAHLVMLKHPGLEQVSVWDASQNKHYLSIDTPFSNGYYGTRENPVKLTFRTGKEEGQVETPVAKIKIQSNPNPMQTYTNIDYTLSRAGHVNVEIRSLQGRKLTTLVNKQQKAGKHTVTWKGTAASGQRLAFGTYVCVLRVNGEVVTQKIIIQ